VTSIRQAIAASILICQSAGAWATSNESEDYAAARKATCPELVDAYNTTSAAEQKVVAAMKASSNGTIATNVLGVASLAVLGVGFFTWNNDQSADENLADLRHDLDIIRTVAKEKKCELPAAAK
jgi:hypothetical protein